MQGFKLGGWACLTSLLFMFSCASSSDEAPSLSLLSISINGIPLVDGTINVQTDATLEMTFSGAIDGSLFESALSLQKEGSPVSGLTISYTSAALQAVIQVTLDEMSNYTLTLPAGTLGQNGERLDQSVSRSFTTVDQGIVTELNPCTTAGSECSESLRVQNGNGQSGTYHVYSSFPLSLETARWEKLKYAILVQHGRLRNADEYFGYLTTTLNQENLSDETILISTFFKSSSDAAAGELYWSSDWREGQNSDEGLAISSFAVTDQILAILGDTSRFPVLEKVILTGHSSGALYTHAYATASTAEDDYSQLSFRYVVANSQYFYYPEDVRYNENTGVFESVSNCADFNHWPLGFVNLPPYLSGASKASLDQQLITRKVTYLLGTNDVSTTGTLNTSDCSAVALGSNRFTRGENIFRLMETNFNSTQQHEKVLVSGVGHNGQQMYQSTEFRTWLQGAF